MPWQRRIERTRNGEFRLRLSRGERQLLRQLPAELRSRLNASPDDADLRRLFPPAYEDDAEDEREYRRLTRDELLANRRESLQVLEQSVDQRRLSEDEIDAWMRALNDLRLVLGTRLDVTEETFSRGLSTSHPQARDLSVYAYLTWLQEEIVDTLSARSKPTA